MTSNGINTLTCVPELLYCRSDHYTLDATMPYQSSIQPQAQPNKRAIEQLICPEAADGHNQHLSSHQDRNDCHRAARQTMNIKPGPTRCHSAAAQEAPQLQSSHIAGPQPQSSQLASHSPTPSPHKHHISSRPLPATRQQSILQRST